MSVTVRLFARARELANADRLEVELAVGATVGDLRRRLAEVRPGLVRLLEHCAIAVDDEFAEDGQGLRAGSEVAVLPPVSGG